jgi:hypothetical protein
MEQTPPTNESIAIAEPILPILENVENSEHQAEREILNPAKDLARGAREEADGVKEMENKKDASTKKGAAEQGGAAPLADAQSNTTDDDSMSELFGDKEVMQEIDGVGQSMPDGKEADRIHDARKDDSTTIQLEQAGRGYDVSKKAGGLTLPSVPAPDVQELVDAAASYPSPGAEPSTERQGTTSELDRMPEQISSSTEPGELSIAADRDQLETQRLVLDVTNPQEQTQSATLVDFGQEQHHQSTASSSMDRPSHNEPSEELVANGVAPKMITIAEFRQSSGKEETSKKSHNTNPEAQSSPSKAEKSKVPVTPEIKKKTYKAREGNTTKSNQSANKKPAQEVPVAASSARKRSHTIDLESEAGSTSKSGIKKVKTEDTKSTRSTRNSLASLPPPQPTPINVDDTESEEEDEVTVVLKPIDEDTKSKFPRYNNGDVYIFIDKHHTYRLHSALLQRVSPHFRNLMKSTVKEANESLIKDLKKKIKYRAELLLDDQGMDCLERTVCNGTM